MSGQREACNISKFDQTNMKFAQAKSSASCHQQHAHINTVLFLLIIMAYKCTQTTKIIVMNFAYAYFIRKQLIYNILTHLCDEEWSPATDLGDG